MSFARARPKRVQAKVVVVVAAYWLRATPPAVWFHQFGTSWFEKKPKRVTLVLKERRFEQSFSKLFNCVRLARQINRRLNIFGSIFPNRRKATSDSSRTCALKRVSYQHNRRPPSGHINASRANVDTSFREELESLEISAIGGLWAFVRQPQADAVGQTKAVCSTLTPVWQASLAGGGGGDTSRLLAERAASSHLLRDRWPSRRNNRADTCCVNAPWPATVSGCS